VSIHALPPILVAALAMVAAELLRGTPRSDDAMHRRGPRSRSVRILSSAVAPAALGLAAACVLAPGPAAAALATPWLLVCWLAAARGAARLLGRGLAPAGELAIDGGSVLLAIGGVWAWAACAGWSLLGYAPLWVWLTAAHFHAAGFILPVLAGLLARRRRSGAAAIAIAGLLAAVPVTAIGIAWSRPLEQAGGLAVAASALLIGALAIGEGRRVGGATGTLVAATGATFFLTMPLAADYALGARLATLLGPSDPLAAMIVWHGAANAMALALAGAAATLARPRPQPLDAPAGRPHSALAAGLRVGADFFARLGLETDREAHGLVDSLAELGHPGFDTSRVAPAVAAFYERTDRHRLLVRPRWRAGFRTGARVWARIGRAMGQLQIPVAAERGDERIACRVVALDDRADGRPGARAWVRTFADGRAMYAAAYATHRLGSTPYMNIAFPVPGGNLASILRMDPITGDARGDAVVLTTRDEAGQPGDAGIWLAVRIGRRMAPLRLPMNEIIRVWAAGMPGVPADLAAWAADGASALARHELWLCSVRYLVLDYAIFPSDVPSGGASMAST
jgi:YndJ-like protein